MYNVRVIILLLVFIFLISCGGGSSGSNSKSYGNINTNPPKAVFLAIYMVGSDLESRGEAATTDLLELINGYKNLLASEKEKISVFVAFGGANSDGWRGVKYADMQCLIHDSLNNQFGDDSCYEYVQEINPQNLKDMGDEEAFEHFLSTVKNKSSGYSKKILILWNHGGAYKGFGWDENWHNDNLELNEIKEAFHNTGVFFDIIGFDACLMANLETAVSVKDYGKYLVASEELEPGHGWNYTDIVNIIAKNSSLSVLDIAKKFVDSYIENPSHFIGKGLTLSVIDLSKINNIVDEINTSINSLQALSLQSFVNAEKETEKFGFSINKDLETDFYSADAISYFDKLGFSNIKNKLQEAVVYNRTDGSLIANGLSFYPIIKGIRDIASNTSSYSIQNGISQDYINFLQSKALLLNADTNPPIISDLGSCTYDGENGKCYQIYDDETAISEVNILSFYYDSLNDKYYLVTSDFPIKKDTNQFFINSDDYNFLIYICSGSCEDINSPRVLLPLYFLYKTVSGDYVYISKVYATVQNSYNLDGFFILRFNPNTDFFDYYVTDSPTSKIRLTLGKEVNNVTFRYLYVDTLGNVGLENGYTISFSSPSNVDFDVTDTSLLHILFVEDLAGNNISIYLN